MLNVKLVFLLIFIVGLISAFLIKSYAGLLIFYFTFAIFVPFLYAKFYEKNIKRPFLEGGVISVLIPLFAIKRLYLASIGFFGKNFIMVYFWNLNWIDMKELIFIYVLLFISLFCLGGAVCSIKTDKDFFKREFDFSQNLISILIFIFFILLNLIPIIQMLINSEFVWW